MKTKKRPKRSRYRGTHTHQRGAKKKARGKGHRGGVGMAGTGHNADQKKTLITKKYGHSYFGVSKRRSGRSVKTLESIDLRKVIESLEKFGKPGKNGWDLDLSGKKVLCTGELKEKLNIKADEASKSAIEKIKKAGGSIELKEKSVNKPKAGKKGKD